VGVNKAGGREINIDEKTIQGSGRRGCQTAIASKILKRGACR
jgi:hypothetical protein